MRIYTENKYVAQISYGGNYENCAPVALKNAHIHFGSKKNLSIRELIKFGYHLAVGVYLDDIKSFYENGGLILSEVNLSNISPEKLLEHIKTGLQNKKIYIVCCNNVLSGHTYVISEFQSACITPFENNRLQDSATWDYPLFFAIGRISPQKHHNYDLNQIYGLKSAEKNGTCRHQCLIPENVILGDLGLLNVESINKGLLFEVSGIKDINNSKDTKYQFNEELQRKLQFHRTYSKSSHAFAFIKMMEKAVKDKDFEWQRALYESINNCTKGNSFSYVFEAIKEELDRNLPSTEVLSGLPMVINERSVS